jgi:hypothetical protein
MAQDGTAMVIVDQRDDAQEEDAGAAASPWRWTLAALGLLLVVAYLVLIPVGVIARDDRLGTPEAILAAAVILGILFAAQTSYAIKGLTIGSSGLVASFERIEARQDVLEGEIRALQVTLTGLVTKFEVIHLEKLAGEAPAVVRFSEIMLRELEHLDAMEFVRPTDLRGLNAIRDHSNWLDDFDLKRYIEITREGREYLALRARLAARTARRRAAS